MRSKLETELVNVLVPYRNSLPMEDIKAQIRIILNDYEIEPRKTEIIIREEDKNNRYIALFLATKLSSGRTDKTIQAYKKYLTNIFSSIEKNADEITADDIKLYLAKKLRIDKCSKISVDNERRVLSTFYSWMLLNENISKNPMDKVEVMKHSKQKKEALTDIEVEKIRGACRTERETAVIETLLSTWCRVSELTGMRIDEIKADKIIVHGKGEKDRTVFLNAKAQIALENYLKRRGDDNPFIFPKSQYHGDVAKFTSGVQRSKQGRWYERAELVSKDEPCDKGTIESMVRAIGKRAGVNKAHPHRFRRTGATNALKAGMSIMTISKLLGHSNIGVTQVYLDVDDEDLENEHSKYVR